MTVEKRKTPYFDKYGKPISEGDITRSWIKDSMNKMEGGDWLYEKVAFYNDNWVLMEIEYDYENATDKPCLLKDFWHKVEIVQDLSVLD